MTGHGVYEADDDPGPAPGSIPVCPMCPTDRERDVIAVGKPAGYVCRHPLCGAWFPATPPPSSHPKIQHMRKVWVEETRGGVIT